MTARAVALMSMLAALSLGIPLIGEAPPSGAARITGEEVSDSFNPTEGKVFVLVIGNDAREGNPTNGARADAMHIIGVDTDTMRAGILNFPRDTYVEVPGHGSMKMNESLDAGGPDLLVKTVEQETGISIDYWVMTGFTGFRRIVRDIGGLRVFVPTDMHDPGGSGAKLKKGPQKLNSSEALAFNRTRKVLPNGDIDRTTNQGLFLLALLKKLHRDTRDDPAALLKWMAITRKWTLLDVPVEELFRLGVLATQLDVKAIKAKTVPVSIGAVGAASVVFTRPEARALYKKFERNASF